MLVLTRHEGESIIINHQIKIMVVRIDGGKVRLAIDAPKDVPVHREEVEERINEE
jgi:carbon storage regulator